ncbi:hypothetical protein CAJAP_07351 [Camponotus japonicus]
MYRVSVLLGETRCERKGFQDSRTDRRLGLFGKETTPICRIYGVTARRSRSTHPSETDGDVLIIGATRNDVLLPRKSVAAAVDREWDPSESVACT